MPADYAPRVIAKCASSHRPRAERARMYDTGSLGDTFLSRVHQLSVTAQQHPHISPVHYRQVSRSKRSCLCPASSSLVRQMSATSPPCAQPFTCGDDGDEGISETVVIGSSPEPATPGRFVSSHRCLGITPLPSKRQPLRFKPAVPEASEVSLRSQHSS
jgi:hypothetical protein